MAPLGVAGAISVFTSASEVRYCDGNDWITINNAAAVNGTTGCSLVTALQGQLIYSASDYKFCYYNGVLMTARSIRSNSPVLLSNPDGIAGSAGKLYYFGSFKETVFHNGTSWYRTRPNPVTFSTPGSYSFRSPGYQSNLTIKVWGAGGAGSAVTGWGLLCGGVTCGAGGAGGGSSISGTGVSLSAGGGTGGSTCTAGGAGGATTGGGAGSSAGAGASDASGGSAPGGGGAGGVLPGTGDRDGDPGDAPGAGGSSNSRACGLGSLTARGGGSGGYTIRTYSVGQVTPGTLLSITVGSGGVENAGSAGFASGAGGAGRVEISWD